MPLSVKRANKNFIAKHFNGMWLLPDDPLAIGADPDGAAPGVRPTLVFSPGPPGGVIANCPSAALSGGWPSGFWAMQYAQTPGSI